MKICNRIYETKSYRNIREIIDYSVAKIKRFEEEKRI